MVGLVVGLLDVSIDCLGAGIAQWIVCWAGCPAGNAEEEDMRVLTHHVSFVCPYACLLVSPLRLEKTTTYPKLAARH